jgi:RNA polymerase-interacting CarD/CdnL/TRCF family regulator
MLRARELAHDELALARDKAVAEALRKKESEKREEAQQPNSTYPPPVGSGGSCAKLVRQVRKKKIQKKSPATGRRFLTRQARGRFVVKQ